MGLRLPFRFRSGEYKQGPRLNTALQANFDAISSKVVSTEGGTITGEVVFDDSKVVIKGTDTFGGSAQGLFFQNDAGTGIAHIYIRDDTGVMQWDGSTRVGSRWRFVSGLTTSGEIWFSGNDSYDGAMLKQDGSGIIRVVGSLRQSAAPSNADDLVNKAYADTLVASSVTTYLSIAKWLVD